MYEALENATIATNFNCKGRNFQPINLHRSGWSKRKGTLFPIDL